MQKRYLAAFTLCLLLCDSSTATAQDILLFDDSDNNDATYALESLEYPYTPADRFNFVPLLSGSSWDLVIMDLPYITPFTPNWELVVSNYIALGGHVIFTCEDEESTSQLEDAFEISISSPHSDIVDIHWWDGSHDIFTRPNTVLPLVAGYDVWINNGFFVEATGSAIELAGGTTTATRGAALIVLGNGGRTFYNGFLFDDYTYLADGWTLQDRDRDGTSDIEQLIQNQVEFLLDTIDGDGDGVSPSEGDCNDDDPDIFPAASEDCNGVDDDCDPATEDGEDEPWYDDDCDGEDDDLCQEGTLRCLGGVQICTDTTGHNEELCNGLDDDCDRNVPAEELDSDEDGFRGCERDCDDTNELINPGARELCNGVDDDCDDRIDEDCEADGDADGDSDGDGDGDSDGNGDDDEALPVAKSAFQCRAADSHSPESGSHTNVLLALIGF